MYFNERGSVNVDYLAAYRLFLTACELVSNISTAEAPPQVGRVTRSSFNEILMCDISDGISGNIWSAIERPQSSIHMYPIIFLLRWSSSPVW
jgi:hypothetical protein